MTGSSLFDYTHVQDHQELAEQLGLNSQGIYSTCNNTSSAASDDGNNSNTSRAVTPTLPERSKYEYLPLHYQNAVSMSSHHNAVSTSIYPNTTRMINTSHSYLTGCDLKLP